MPSGAATIDVEPLPPRKRSSLTRRVIIISMVGLVAGSVVAAAFGAHVLLRERGRARLDLAAAAAGAAERMRGQLSSVEQTLRVVAAMPEIIADPATCAARIGEVQREMDDLTSAMLLTDAQGVVRCAMPRAAIGRDLRSLASFRAAQAGTDATVSSIVVGTFTPEELVGVSLRLPLAGGGRGMIAAGVRVRALTLPARATGRDISLWLVDTEGRVIGLQGDAQAVPPPSDILARLAGSETAITVTTHEVRLLAAANPVAHTLAVVATRPLQSVEAEALDLTLWALLPAVTTLAVAIGLIALLLQRAVLLPLRLMAAGLDGTTPVAASAIRHRVPAELDAIWARVAQYQQQVREREDRLTDALDARTHLMREVHHRTKNNLQIVSSLLALQERRSDDTDVAEQLRTARERVATLATLHQQLYGGIGGDRMDLQGFLEDLTKAIARASGADARGLRIRVDCDPVRLSMDQGAPLGLVVNELVTNSLKYGFIGRERGLISVTARQRGDDLEVVVADDGIGAPDDRLPQGGLGSLLVSAFARQLGGRLERRPVPGTVIALTFPLDQSPAAADAERVQAG